VRAVEEQYYPLVYEVEERHWWFRGRRAVLSALLRRAGIEPPVRVLDAGCGTGRNLQDYRRLGPVTGVDPSATAVEFCRERGLGGIIQAGVESLPFEAAAFDLILATDVLEHVDDDLAALLELRRVAAADAMLVMTVPAYMWLWTASDDALQHRRRYSRRELAERAAAAGWEPVIATYFNSILLPPIALARALRGRFGNGRRPELEVTPPLLDRVLAAPIRIEASLIAHGASLPAGVSVGMVCRSTGAPVSDAAGEAGRRA
jgi:SAM-dependent methyltransferase